MLIHAGSGQVSLRGGRGLRAGVARDLVVVVVKDDGPGIANVEAAMVDGYSTGQGLGMGLSGARRLVDAFELRSAVGEGTTIALGEVGCSAPRPPLRMSSPEPML